MGFLDNVVLPDKTKPSAPVATSSFVRNVIPPPAGFVASAPQPSASAQENLDPTSGPGGTPISFAKRYLRSVLNQAQGGIQQIKQPYIDKAQRGGSESQGQALKGALDVGSGVVSLLTSPIAPITKILNAVIQTSGKGYANIPAVQKFAQTPAGQTTRNVAGLVAEAAPVAGALLGGFAKPNVAEAIPKTVAPELPTPEPVVTAKAPSEVQSTPTHPSSIENTNSIEPTSPVIPKTVETTSVPKTSKIASSLNAKAVEQNLTEGFKDLAGYDPKTIKDQAAKITSLMENNMSDVRAIINGDKPVPDGISGTYLIKAAEDQAVKTGDTSLIQDLAKSPLTSETSRFAQELRMAAERNPESPVAAIKEITQAYNNRAVRTGATADKLKADVNTEIAKVAPKKQTWSQFIDEITC